MCVYWEESTTPHEQINVSIKEDDDGQRIELSAKLSDDEKLALENGYKVCIRFYNSETCDE